MARKGRKGPRPHPEPETRPRSTEPPPEPAGPGGPRFWQLVPLVFCCGGSIMAVEIIGARLLHPHFGNSVYVWGAILSVFMAALACGYWLGGRISDAAPSFTLLNIIVMVAAGTVLAAPYLVTPVATPLEDLGEKWGPLWASVALYFIPSMLLAMVSPFAVRLAARSLLTIGHLAGRLYALSTVGSIAGALVTTYVLIGSATLTHSLLGCAALLALLAGVNLVLSPVLRARPVAGVALLFVAGLLFLPEAQGYWQPQGDEELRDDVVTPYHRIMIIRDPSSAYLEGKPVIDMRFDRYKESGIIDQPPYYSTSEYTDLFHIAHAFINNPQRIAFIGAGGGLGPRTFRMVYPDTDIDVVDIDGEVLRLCQKHFHLQATDDPHMHLHAEDGRTFLRRQVRDGEPLYDAVVLDAFTTGGRIPWHLTTTEYFQEIRASLRRTGVLVMNVIGALEEEKSYITRSIYRSMSAAFTRRGELPEGYVHAFQVRYTEDDTQPRNVILIASNRPPLTAVAIQEAVEEFDRLKILQDPIASVVTDMIPVEETRRWLEPDPHVPLLTDEFCPVETMPFMARPRLRD